MEEQMTKPIARLASLLRVAAMAALALTISVPSSAQFFFEFDVPGSVGTVATDINSAGKIVGNYALPSNAFGAFVLAPINVRFPEFKFTTFNAPGAGTGANQGTSAWSINSKGDTTGYYVDGSNVYHGYLRLSDGTITTFDVPGAGAGSGQGTLAYNLGSKGEIAGEYIDGNNVLHGFTLWLGPGAFTSFDAPGAGTGPGQGTLTASEDGLTRKGSLAGGYLDGSNVYHGLLRLADGTMTEFDATGAGTGAYQGTNPGGIDSKDTISGYYTDGNNVYHGFQRLKDGAITTFDVPGAGTAPGQGTQGENINATVGIDGQYIDGNNVYHCFTWTDGNIGVLPDAPGAGTAPGQGTFAGPLIFYGTINGQPFPAIAGYYVDGNDVFHGYFWTLTPPLELR
jgi:hypothetical protein